MRTRNRMGLLTICLVSLVFSAGEAFASGTTEQPETDDRWMQLRTPMPENENTKPPEYGVELTNEGAEAAASVLVRYNDDVNIAQRIYTILENHRGKVFLEGHLGMAAHFPLDGMPCRFQEIVALKWNLINQKRPYAERTLSQLIALREYLGLRKITLSDATLSELALAERENRKYLSSLPFGSAGIGISFPFNLMTAHGDWNSFQRMFSLADVYMYASYDIMNVVSIHLGTNVMKFDSVNLGISLDVTTPVYDFLMGFGSFFRSWWNGRAY